MENKRILSKMENIQIVEYSSIYQEDFKRLNEEWISTYFEMEEADKKALNDPENYILNKGGKILVAIEDKTVLGVCALLKMTNDDFDYELAKMAVSPKAQGKGLGYLLGKTMLERAKQLGAKKIYLETNSLLQPALSLYNKLGFKKITGFPSPYKRCDIQMELELKNA